MRQFFAFFLLITMTLNVTLPFVERLVGGALCELVKASQSDDSDEESKKEKEQEKETLSFPNGHQTGIFGAFNLYLTGKSTFAASSIPVSELFASLPEQPPKV